MAGLVGSDAGINVAEAQAEFGLCARYGELDEMVEMWDGCKGMLDVDFADAQGSTALHMAAANGHTEVVAWLLKRGARCCANASGNSPLLWALLNKQKEAAVLLLKRGLGVDVLETNATGKSAVSFAYDANDTELLQLVLEHPSAARLNRDGSVAPKGTKSDLERDEEADAAGEPSDAASLAQEQTHTSTLRIGETVVRVREIGFVDALGAGQVRAELGEGDLATTGAFLWAASLILAQWIAGDLREALGGKAVVELGAGCGLPGLAASLCTAAASVTVTDMESRTFANTEHNVQLCNIDEGRALSAATLDWCDQATWPADLVGSTDAVIGSDLVYDLALVAPLVSVIRALLKPGAGSAFYYVSADTDRAGCKEFVRALQDAGFSMQAAAVPDELCGNPIDDCDEPAFALRFPEFASTTFTMYTFRPQVAELEAELAPGATA